MTHTHNLIAGNQSCFQWNWAVYILCINIVRPMSMEYLFISKRQPQQLAVGLEKFLLYLLISMYTDKTHIQSLYDLFKKNKYEE